MSKLHPTFRKLLYSSIYAETSEEDRDTFAKWIAAGEPIFEEEMKPPVDVAEGFVGKSGGAHPAVGSYITREYYDHVREKLNADIARLTRERDEARGAKLSRCEQCEAKGWNAALEEAANAIRCLKK